MCNVLKYCKIILNVALRLRCDCGAVALIFFNLLKTSTVIPQTLWGAYRSTTFCEEKCSINDIAKKKKDITISKKCSIRSCLMKRLFVCMGNRRINIILVSYLFCFALIINGERHQISKCPKVLNHVSVHETYRVIFN